MTVHDVGVRQCAEDSERKCVCRLGADVPWSTDDANAQLIDCFLAILIAERDERCRHVNGHVPCKLEYVPFGAPDDAGRPEERRDQMRHVHGLFHDFQLEVQEPCGKKPRPSLLVLRWPSIGQPPDHFVEER